MTVTIVTNHVKHSYHKILTFFVDRLSHFRIQLGKYFFAISFLFERLAFMWHSLLNNTNNPELKRDESDHFHLPLSHRCTDIWGFSAVLHGKSVARCHRAF